jgi:integrase/recombinase XerC
MNVTNALDRFTRQLAANGCSVHTQGAYRRDLGALRRWIGKDQALSRITPDTLARFLVSDAVLLTPDGQPRKAISVNRTKSSLRSFLAYCVEAGWIKDNPARLIRSTPTTPKEPTTLTESDIEKIRKSIFARTPHTALRDRLIFEILLGTGMRLGSLVGLDIGDVDLDSGIMHIRTKGGGQDMVFLHPGLQRLLGRFLDEVAPEANSGPNVPLFRSRHGSRLGARVIQLRFAQTCQIAGLSRRVSIHSMRHTFATRLYDKTGDLYLVQRALGHRQITTTEVYARVNDSALRATVGGGY